VPSPLTGVPSSSSTITCGSSPTTPGVLRRDVRLGGAGSQLRGHAVGRADPAVGGPGSPRLLHRLRLRAGRAPLTRPGRPGELDAGWSHADWLRNDPDWTDYRDEPQFHGLLKLLESARRT
jgi:hypothetical protein